MAFNSFEEIIEYAIEKEKEAAAFYADAATQESFSGVKDMLLEMSEEEKKHQTMLESIGKKQEVVEKYKLKWIPDLKRSDYLVDIEYDKGMPYADLLRLAMKREEKALKMYNDLQAKAEDEEHIKVFKILCQEEAKHKLKLESLYDDYMAGQGD